MAVCYSCSKDKDVVTSVFLDLKDSIDWVHKGKTVDLCNACKWTWNTQIDDEFKN